MVLRHPRQRSIPLCVLSFLLTKLVQFALEFGQGITAGKYLIVFKPTDSSDFRISYYIARKP